MECQGGRIDAAHHNGHAVRALSETLAFEKAIEVNFVIGTKFSFRPIFMEFFSGSGEGCKSRGDTDSCYCGPCAHHEVLLHQQKQSLESLTSIGGYTNREYNITGSIDGDDNEVMSILRCLIEWNPGFAKFCSYGNGPGFRNLMTQGEGNFTQIDRANVTLEKNASAPLKFRQVFFMKESKEPKGPSWSRFFKQISIFLCQQRQQYC